jgi:hypothetical protein
MTRLPAGDYGRYRMWPRNGVDDWGYITDATNGDARGRIGWDFWLGGIDCWLMPKDESPAAMWANIQPFYTQRAIRGKVTEKTFGQPLTFANVTFRSKSASTDSNGYYSIIDPELYSDNVICSLTGYVTQNIAVTSPQTGTIFVNFSMVPTTVPPSQYKKLPRPPAGFPAAFLPAYMELDDALYAGDAARALNVLRTNMWMEGSPIVFLAAIGAILGVVGLIVTLVGSYPFAGFLVEEALQTIDMALYTAQTNKEYDLAQKALNKKKEILTPTLLSNILGAIPFANVLAALTVYTDASKLKMEIDQEIINRKIDALVTPNPGDVLGYADAFDRGFDTAPFMPKRYSILKIDPNVSGGEVLVDGVGWSVIFPFSIETVPGTHTVVTKSAGYADVTDIVQVDPYTIKVHSPFLTKLPEEVTKGSLEVITTPEGADIYINGSLYTYPTNAVISSMTPGQYSIEIKKTGYNSETRTVTIAAGTRSSINIYLVAAVTPPTEWPVAMTKEIIAQMIEVPTTYNAWKYTLKTVEKATGAPLSAKIFINGEDTGKWTPFYFYFFPSTSYVLRFERWGYVPVEMTETTGALPAT